MIELLYSKQLDKKKKKIVHFQRIFTLLKYIVICGTKERLIRLDKEKPIVLTSDSYRLVKTVIILKIHTKVSIQTYLS